MTLVAGLPATVTSLLSLTCAKLVKEQVYVKENEMVELKCIVQEAKPKAQIVWFRENSEFVTGEVCSLCLMHLVLSDSHFFQANH